MHILSVNLMLVAKDWSIKDYCTDNSGFAKGVLVIVFAI